MKAQMDEHGVITLMAETGAEKFALDSWMQKARTPGNMTCNEDALYRGSYLRVSGYDKHGMRIPAPPTTR